MSLLSIFSQEDYQKGSVILTAETLKNEVYKAFTFSDEFGSQHRLNFFSDREYLVMTTDRLFKWVNKYHTSIYSFGKYIPETLDCDDHEAMFAGDRVKGRWKSRLKAVEAIGWIDYFPKSGVYHRAAWAASTNAGKFLFHIYQPQVGTWNDGSEVVRGVLAGA